MKTDEYIPLDARVHHDGRVDVVIEGEPVEGGQGLPMESVLSLLAGFARQNGTLLMSTQMPDGRTTRELVTGTGEVLPYFPDEESTAPAETAAAVSPVSSHKFYETLKRRSKSTPQPASDPALAPVSAPVDIGEDLFAGTPAATSTPQPVPVPKFGAKAAGFKEQNMNLSAHDVPVFDVEADVQEALAARKGKGKRGMLPLLAIVAVVLVVLVVLVAAGVALFSGAGALTGAAPALPSTIEGPALLLSG